MEKSVKQKLKAVAVLVSPYVCRECLFYQFLNFTSPFLDNKIGTALGVIT